MGANNLPDAGYDRTKGPDKEGTGDAATIRTIYERDGADAAATRFREEVDKATASGATQQDLETYRQSLMKGLAGDGTTANVLPELALGFGMQQKDKIMSARLGIGGDMVDDNKLREARDKETNPIYKDMYNLFDRRYKEIQTENANRGITDAYSTKLDWGNPVWARQLDGMLKAGAEKARANTENRSELGLLATHPTLFKDIANGDGQITRDEAKAFKEKWNQGYPQQEEFRNRYGKTAAERQAVENTVNKLVDSFDQEKNKDNKPGSVLKDNNKGAVYGMNYGAMTEQSLAEGMGYRNIAEAKARLPKDTATPGVKPIAEVNSVTNYSSTAQGRNEGPAQVANRMLRGDTTQDQTKFFTKPDEAQRMLTDVLKKPEIWKFDQQGKPHVTAENRDDVLNAIKAAEAKKATDSRQPENNELSKWFESRYPKLPAEAAPTRGEPTATTDWNHLKLKDKNDGPRAIAGRMLQGQDAFFDDPAKAARDLTTALGVKAGIHNSRQGAEQVTKDNYDKVIESIKATNNPQLLAWFQKRYLKPS